MNRVTHFHAAFRTRVTSCVLECFFLAFANGVIGCAVAAQEAPVTADRDDATGVRLTEAFAAIAPLRKTIELAAVEKRPFPTGMMSVRSRNVQSVHVSPQGAIDIIFARDLLGGSGRFLMVPFFDSSNKVKWNCLAGIPQKYVPPECLD